MNEAELIAKLQKIEAVHAGAATPGERAAALQALERVRARLRSLEPRDPAIEFKFTLNDEWSRKLFLAIVRRYGLRPYRNKGQRYTTVMVSAPRSFVEDTLWPEFVELDRELRAYLGEVTERVVQEALRTDTRDPEVA